MDKELDLPTRIVAVSDNEDVHDIRLIHAKVDEGLGDAVFEPAIPEEFTHETFSP